MQGNKSVWLIDGSRTPIGAFGKSLNGVTVDKLVQHSIHHTLRRTGVHPERVDGFILGHGFQSSYTPNTARFSWLNAGYPDSVPAITVQVQCGSGMKAVNLAMDAIKLGQGNIYLAGGAESMSTIPYLVPGSLRFSGFLSKYFKFGPRPFAGLVDDGMVPRQLLWDETTTFMAATAQRLADAYGISRQEADDFALRSQTLAREAIASGRFAREIEAFQTRRGFFTQDEHPRQTSAEALAGLKPVLKQRDITAGNSSGINDGACTVLIAEAATAKELGLSPIVELVDHCLVGVDPREMGLGPVLAIRTLLARHGLTLADVGLVEINEAFAHQTVACAKLLGLPLAKLNVNGGAIALGHPIAMSGARVLFTLGLEMKLRGVEWGVSALCIGGGLGIATLQRLVR